jgi:hypothetical protein
VEEILQRRKAETRRIVAEAIRREEELRQAVPAAAQATTRRSVPWTSTRHGSVERQRGSRRGGGTGTGRMRKTRGSSSCGTTTMLRLAASSRTGTTTTAGVMPQLPAVNMFGRRVEEPGGPILS